MCGILGGIGSKSQVFVLENLQSLIRRGPDNNGFIALENGLCLGATRLAMTDPHERSNQPMIDLTTNNALVFNGEIYNYKWLRNKLISRNIKINTESDTEVVLKFLSEFGFKGIAEFEGMFAFAFYNYKKNSLIVARDFLGKKPLYYRESKNAFYFSSQASLLKKTLASTTLNTHALNEYLRIGYIQDPYTMYNDIYAVNPGEFFEVNLSNLSIDKRMVISPRSLSEESNLSFRELLNKAILERTIGHDQFAISMSGGKDSALIAMQSKDLGLNFTAYTMSFSDSDKERYNFDADASKKICKSLKINHKIIEMPNVQEIPEIMESFLKAMDEPNINPTGLAQLILFSNIAKNGNRLVLTGDGADEIFGGYLRYSKAKKLRLIPQIRIKALEKIISADIDHIPLIKKVAYSFIRSDSDDCWLYWHQIMSNRKVANLVGSNFKIYLNREVIANLTKIKSKNRVFQLMSKDLAIYIAMESNRRLDRTSMWSSIEARSPFQSERLINYAYSYMSRNHFSKVNKNIFFDEFPNLQKLPLVKDKIGFVSPLGHWLRSNKKWVDDSLFFLMDLNVFQKESLLDLIDSQYENSWENTRFLWGLVVLANWFKLNF